MTAPFSPAIHSVVRWHRFNHGCAQVRVWREVDSIGGIEGAVNCFGGAIGDRCVIPLIGGACRG